MAAKRNRQDGLSDSFKPGSFGWHELLDRTCLLAESFETYVSNHPSADHPKLRKQVTALEQKLYDLYSAIANID